MAVNSIRKRYFVKLAVSVCSSLFGLISIGIVPRALGPAQYGNFNFLNRSLSQFLLLLQFSSENSFLTKLSQRNFDKQLIGFYTFLFVFSTFIFITSGLVVFSLDIFNIFLPGQAVDFICMAAAHVILVLLVTRLIALADAFALISVEFVRILQRLIYVCLIIVFFKFYSLNLKSLYIIHYISSLMFIVPVVILLCRSNILTIGDFFIPLKRMKFYLIEFVHYSYPLTQKLIWAFFAVYIQLWMLRKFGGSEQFGFYGFAQQMVNIISPLFAVIAPVFHREIAVSYARENLNEIRTIYQKYVFQFFTVMTYICVFLAVELDKIIIIVGGNAYENAFLPCFILLLTTTLNPVIILSQRLLLATDQTKKVRNIGMIKVCLGLIISYFLIAPKHMYGLGLGAVGLVAKIAVVQIYAIVAQLYVCTKHMNINFLRFIVRILFSLSIFICIALVVDNLTLYVTYSIPVLFSLLLDGILYTIFSALIVYLLSNMFFFEREDLVGYFKKALNLGKSLLFNMR